MIPSEGRSSATKRGKPSAPKALVNPYADLDDDPPGGPAPEQKPKRSAYELDDDLPPPPRAPWPPEDPSRARGKTTRSDYHLFDAVPGKVLLVGVGLIGCAMLLTLINKRLGWPVLLASLLLTVAPLYIYGLLGFLIRPFQEGALHGLACLFVPFYSLYYLITRWDGMRGPFLNTLAAGGIVLSMGLFLAALTSVIPPDDLSEDKVVTIDPALAADLQPQVRGGDPVPQPRMENGPFAPLPPAGGPPPVPFRPVPNRNGPVAAPARVADIDGLLRDLKSDSLHDRRVALGRLLTLGPDPARRTDVARAVEVELGDTDGFTRANAARVLASWGGHENTPALVKALNDPAFNVRWAVLDALAGIGDPAAAGPVAAFLPTDRVKAGAALKAMGAAAEPGVIPYLGHSDLFVRAEAAKILQEIGTRESIEPLRGLVRSVNGRGLDATAATEALRVLDSRNGGGPAPRRR